MVVNFSNSGTLSFGSLNSITTSSGLLSFYNEENNTTVSSYLIPNQGNSSINYVLDNMHTSKDSYYVAYGAKGRVGECRTCSGLSPTVPVYIENFNGRYISESGTQILYKDFEDNSSSGLNYTYYGTGITESGINSVPPDTFSGNYWSSLISSSPASMYIQPSGTVTSGMLSGRTIFLTWMGISNDSQAVGISFLRQDPSITGTGYTVYLHNVETTQYELILKYGQIGAATTGMITSVGTALRTIPLDFSSSTIHDSMRGHWISVEWEVNTNYSPVVKIGVSHKIYSTGDTIETVRNSLTQLFQLDFKGGTDGVGLYTTTLEPVVWILPDTSTGRVAIDQIYVESGTLTNKGLFNNQLITYSGTDISIGSMGRAFNSNYIQNNGINTGPEGSAVYGGSVYSITKEDSIYGNVSYGYGGLSVSRIGGSTGNQVLSSYILSGEGSSGIKHGVFRGVLEFNSSADISFGFSFLRQGVLFNNNCYTLEVYRNAANDIRVRLKKGSVVAEPFDSTLSFNGSLLSTSSTLTEVLDNTEFWLEILWKATSVTNIEVRFKKVAYPYYLPNSSDHSPGNVDYNLTSILNYTDSSSPYLTTSVRPMISFITTEMYIHLRRWELRRAKLGN